MPRVNRNFGEIDGHQILVYDNPAYIGTRFWAWPKGMKGGPGQAFGSTPEIAVERLKDRAERGRTTGDPGRRALLPTGNEALSVDGVEHGRGPSTGSTPEEFAEGLQKIRNRRALLPDGGEALSTRRTP